MPAKRKTPNLSQVSREAGVSRETLRKWRDVEGIDVTDIKAVRKRASIKQPRPAGSSIRDTGESYSEARRRREIAIANRAEIITEREAGKVIDVGVVDAAFGRLGAELRARLLAMRSSLVTELEGQSASGIYQILHDRFCELLEAIHTNKPIPKS